MIPILNTEQVREVETAADKSGLSYDEMMDRAGQAVSIHISKMLNDTKNPKVTFLCGKGNNGGDGLVAARYLSEELSGQVSVYLLSRRDENDPIFDALDTDEVFIAYEEDDRDHRVLRNLIASSDLIVDAIFGIGIHLPIRDQAARVLRSVNQALNLRRDELRQRPFISPTYPQPLPISDPLVLAVDCPSGLNCDTGEVDSNTISADETLTFISAKKGLLEFPGAATVGKLTVVDIGVPPDLPELQNDLSLVHSAYIRSLLPKRSTEGNKGTFGKLMAVAGSQDYMGAPSLAAHGAYRSGVGLVSIATPAPVAVALAGGMIEATWLGLPHDDGVISEEAVSTIAKTIAGYKALLIGPGMTQATSAKTFLTTLLNHNSDLPPLVIDADGLNILSQLKNWWERVPSEIIITPHPGEMARLCSTDTQDVLANRIDLTREKANLWNVIIVLKGAHTIIASPAGQVAVQPFKNDGLATAGTGDILAGIISGFRAQGLEAFQAAVAGAYVHGLAGELAVKRQKSTRSLIASDLFAHIGEAFQLIED